MEFDLFTILPLAVAVFVFWKLRSVLGSRDGAERPPYEPPVRPGNEAGKTPAHDQDNVVTLPTARDNQPAPADEVDPIEKRIAEIAGRKRNLKQGLMNIYASDPDFDPDQFLSGSRMAYEMIVTAFADGDKRTLKGLLSRDVFDNFEAAIDDRQSRGERVEATFVGIESANMTGAELLADEAQISVAFVSQMISVTLDGDDAVVEGDQSEVAEITDIWTFARSTKSRDPNWKLVATDA